MNNKDVNKILEEVTSTMSFEDQKLTNEELKKLKKSVEKFKKGINDKGDDNVQLRGTSKK